MTIVSIMSGLNTNKTFLEILTPPEQISTARDFTYFIGYTNTDKVVIALNGQEIAEVEVKDSIFHFHAHYPVGLNEIAVYPATDDSTAVKPKITEILYSPTVSRKYSRYYPAYAFHDKVPKDRCTSCHKNEYNPDDTISSAVTCYDCHIHTKETFKTHIVNDTLACLTCHYYKADLTYISGAGYYDDNPCFSCHSASVGKFDNEYIHGPVAGGSCTICHNSHGSDQPAILNESQEILCFSCHFETEEKRKLKIQHPPFHSGKCGSCHDPHATSHKWVLIKDSEYLCLNCHQDSNGLDFHQHPYNVKPKRNLEADLKLTDRGKLECLSCHNPHATESEHLLRVNSEVTCMGCHPGR